MILNPRWLDCLSNEEDENGNITKLKENTPVDIRGFEMTEEQILDLLNKEYMVDLDKELVKIYPSGFEINQIDKRIRDKIEELTNKYDSIQNPVQIRKNNKQQKRDDYTKYEKVLHNGRNAKRTQMVLKTNDDIQHYVMELLRKRFYIKYERRRKRES